MVDIHVPAEPPLLYFAALRTTRSSRPHQDVLTSKLSIGVFMFTKYVDIDGLYAAYKKESGVSVTIDKFTTQLSNQLNLLRVIVKSKPEAAADLNRDLAKAGALMRGFYRKGAMYDIALPARRLLSDYRWLRHIGSARYNEGILRCWGAAAMDSPSRSKAEDTPSSITEMLEVGAICLESPTRATPDSIRKLFPRSVKHRNQMSRVVDLEAVTASATGYGLDGHTWYKVIQCLSTDVPLWYVGSHEDTVTLSDTYHVIIGKKELIK